jgi:2,4-dienoyl-CoA reductase (NADPH2)
MLFEKLFSPGQIGGLELRNRILMPPMGTGMMDLSGEPNNKLIELFARRARGGAAMLITEPLFTEIPTGPEKDIPLPIISAQIVGTGKPRLFEWAEAVQVHDSRICAGLSPLPTRWLMARMSDITKRMDQLEGEVFKGLGVFNHLTTEDVQRHISNFVKGALNLQALGYDAIEINFSMFCDYFTLAIFNKRTDQYGYSEENGLRFVRELIQETRKALGPSYPIMLMLDADQFTPGWRTLGDTENMAPKLEAWGVDAIRCRAGTSVQMQWDTIPAYLPKGAIAYLAAGVKKKVKIPVVANGRLSDPLVAEKVLAEGQADFVSIGRGLLADPDLPNKLRSGRPNRVRKCLSCNTGCMSNLMVHPMRPFRCAVNPILGTEEKFRDLGMAQNKKKVVVAGGGPGGMSAALTALRRGHQVVLFEKERKLGSGGYFRLACIPPFKQENLYLSEYYENEFKDFPNLKLKLNTEATAARILTEKPDAVIIATGAVWQRPVIAGGDSPACASFEDILLERRINGAEIAIVGGGATGCEVAHFLLARGKKVTILEELPRLADEVVHPNRNCLMEELTKAGAVMLTSARVTSISGKTVYYLKEGIEQNLLADVIVFATGSKPSHPLYDEIREHVAEAHVIGDAKKPRQIMEAISEGFHTAWSL